MRTLDDTTPLNGDDLDVAARIGWAVRIARITASNSRDTRLQTMASLLGSSPAHLSRIETGQRRDALLTRLYESAFGIPDSVLGAPISTLSRAFPHKAPRDSGPLRGDQRDVRAFSGLTEHLLSPSSVVTGGEWLDWARSLSAPGNIGLPTNLFLTIAERLLDELDRSVQHAVAPRYEAVALIRGCAYGDLLLELSRPLLVPGAMHRPELLISALSEQPSPETQNWALGLLADESTAAWGSLAIETMSQAETTAFWNDLAAPVAGIHDASAAGSAVERWTAHLLRLVPAEARAPHACPDRPLPDDVVTDWSAQAENPHWAWCEQQATSMAARRGLEPQPVLTRIVFDIALGPWEIRALTSRLLLGALPELAEPLPAHMATYVDENPAAPTRQRVLARLGMMAPATLPEPCQLWFTSDDPALRATALTLAGRAGLSADEVARIAAAKTPHDARHDASLVAEARAALSRWDERGGRIVR